MPNTWQTPAPPDGPLSAAAPTVSPPDVPSAGAVTQDTPAQPADARPQNVSVLSGDAAPPVGALPHDRIAATADALPYDPPLLTTGTLPHDIAAPPAAHRPDTAAPASPVKVNGICTSSDTPAAALPPTSFVLLQQDARMLAAAAVLCQNGCTRLPAEQLPQADFLLLGPPTPTLQPFAAWLQQAKPGALLFAGGVARAARLQAASQELPVVDYLESETLALTNAVYTAEGALGILLGATQGALWGSRLVLIGYGRIARMLAPRLQALGVQLTVAARSQAARTMAAGLGAAAAPLTDLPRLARTADFLVNTVPWPVVDQPVLAALPPHAYVLDLASAPGGVELPAAQELGIRAEAAPGLPGRWCADAAGRAVGHTVLQFLQNRTPAAGTAF